MKCMREKEQVKVSSYNSRGKRSLAITPANLPLLLIYGCYFLSILSQSLVLFARRLITYARESRSQEGGCPQSAAVRRSMPQWRYVVSPGASYARALMP